MLTVIITYTTMP